MANQVLAQCPDCGVKLKLDRQRFAGKTIRCPKCTTTFVPIPAAKSRVARAASTDDEFGGLDDDGPSDDAGSDEDEYGAASAPARQERLPTRRKKSKPGGKKTSKADAEDKKSSKDSKSSAPIIAAVVVVFCVFGLGAFFAVRFFMSGMGGLANKLAAMAGANTSGFNLKYVPERPDVFMQIKVADVLNTPAGKAALNDRDFKAAVDKFTKALGVGLEDVDTVTMATAATEAMRGGGGTAMMANLKAASGEGNKTEARMVVIVRTKKPIDRKALLVAFGYPTAKADVEYAEISKFPYFQPNQMVGCLFPEPNVVVLGSATTMGEVKANKDTVFNVPELANVDPKQHIILAALPDNAPKAGAGGVRMGGMFARGMMQGASPMATTLRILGMTLMTKSKISAAGLTFGDNITLHYVADAGSPEGAKQLLTKMKATVDNGEASGLDMSDFVKSKVKGGKKNDDDDDARPQSVDFRTNPLRCGCWNFGDIASEEGSTSVFSEDDGKTTVDFKATLRGQEAQEEAEQILETLTFYQPERDQMFAYAGMSGLIGDDEDDPNPPGANPQAGNQQEDNKEGQDKDGANAQAAKPAGNEDADKQKEDKQDAKQQPGNQKGGKHRKRIKDIKREVIYALEDARAALKEKGVKVELADKVLGIYTVEINNPDFSDADMDLVSKLRGVTSLKFVASSVTDDGLVKLKNVGPMAALHLTGTKVTDAFAEHVGMFRRLMVLDVSGTGITDAFCEKVVQVAPKSLHRVMVANTQVSDELVRKYRGGLVGFEK